MERKQALMRCAASWGLVLLAMVLAAREARSQPQASDFTERGHVPELARYLDQVEIYAEIDCGRLAVFPVRLRSGDPLRGAWLSMDQANSRGVLVLSEKPGGGQVPVVTAENGSRDQYVLLLSGELLSGGKQTRTVRQDVIVAPGRRVEVPVFCVEARRWEGESRFQPGASLLPQSIHQELRKGADQDRIWAEVARNNAALRAENETGSLELALRSAHVRDRLAEVRGKLLRDIPGDAAGLIVVGQGRALGAAFFGRADLARALLPKVLDSYTVDVVIKQGRPAPPPGVDPQQVAIDFFERVRRGGSRHAATPGAGTGIRTQSPGLVGDGVGFGDALVHYAVQAEHRIIPLPER
jgi:hypothetical protein